MTRVKGGKGGDGLVSFMHLKGNEWAGPDGGDGGIGCWNFIILYSEFCKCEV